MRSAITLGIGLLIAATAPGLHAQRDPIGSSNGNPVVDQAGQTAQQPVKPGTPTASKPGTPPPAKPAAQTPAKPASQAPAKPAAQAPAKPAAQTPAKPGTAPASKPAANLPPGKAGLQVSTLRLDGIVRAPNGMIAVVSNPQSRTYFLREGDHLYDGSVDKITMDGVSFHEEGKDAFGKPVERQVNKRIYSTSSGEQQ